MTLSEAIRLGAMLRPQGFGNGSANRNASRLCAIGAAYVALGIPYGDSILRYYSELNELSRCPECEKKTNLYNIIAHLNDDHKWTREAIAAWVATLEPQEPPAPVPVAGEERVWVEG